MSSNDMHSIGEAGPSRLQARHGVSAGGGNFASSTSETTDLWSDILRSAGKRKVYGQKNIIVLAERHRGRRHLINQLLNSTSNTRRRKRPVGQALALGYEVMQVRDEGDEEGVPPISVFLPPSGEGSAKLVKAALPANTVPDTVVMIVLDWSRPGSMARELVAWSKWIGEWAEGTSEQEQTEMRDKLQAHLQLYTEPVSTSPSNAPTSSYNAGPLLPLGPGTLTLNVRGIPIIVACTRSDLMDSAAGALGLKGAAWEERCDWALQVLRTICLSHGAALFYTCPSQPNTYTLLRSYLLHRLHGTEDPAAHTMASRFTFSHRANVLDRDAIMVPAGWDSWGKIKVLRGGFEPDAILRATERDLDPSDDAGEAESLDDIWTRMLPETSRSKMSSAPKITSHVESEHSFLSRQYDTLQKDPNRDPRAAFRQPSGSAPSTNTDDKYAGYGGVVGPMGSGGLSLPGVEKAMAEMEGQGAEDLKEKFAKLGKKDRGPLSPSRPGGPDRPSTPGVPNEALHSFFQGLLASKGKSGA